MERPVAPRPPWPAGVWVGVVLVVLIAMVAIGLLLRPGKDATPPKPLPPSTTVDPQAAVKEAILDAYRKSWNDFVAVGSDAAATADDNRLRENTTGDVLAQRQLALVKRKAQGEVYRGTFEFHPTVIALTSDTASIRDCNFDRVVVVNSQTGQQVTPLDTQPSWVTTTMKLEGGVWKQATVIDEKTACAPAAS